MRTRIYNARILTMEEGRKIFKGEIQIEDGQISCVKPCDGAEDINKGIWDKDINAQGNLFLPGFKVANSNSPMTFLLSFSDDMKLQEWLYDKVFPAEAELTEEDIYWLLCLVLMSFLLFFLSCIILLIKFRNGNTNICFSERFCSYIFVLYFSIWNRYTFIPRHGKIQHQLYHNNICDYIYCI